MGEKKYFPIKTATACQLKWAWSTINLPLAVTSSCHRVDKHSFDIASFNFHNTEDKIKQRQTMLAGQWPKAGCDYCKSIEDTGIGQSDRQFFSDVPGLSPVELDNDLIATTVTPTILEVYIDNTCNLSCVYCIPRLSSRIDHEMKKFGRFEKNGLVLESDFQHVANFDQVQEQFWIWMQNHAAGLKRLHLLGGEPFYQKQFDRFLEFFETSPCPELEFNIVTNLMISKERLSKHIEQFKQLLAKRKLGRLDITVSIDCWGPQQEYVRWGLDLTQWKENFEYLIEQRWIKLNINNTLSALTIKTLPDLLEIINEYAKNRKIEHYFSSVIYPSYLHYNILGSTEFQEDFQKILKLMETKTWRGTHAQTYMQGLVATNTNSVYNKEETLKLITYLIELDRRRNTNWREIFPWLIKYEALCGIQE
jgi:MoaA/NifB/PqqE/SkfB family radical SAM enzyme